MNEQTLIIDSDSAKLKEVRAEIGKCLRASGFQDKPLEEMLVAVGEGAANAIRHAYQGEKGHEVRITYQDHPDRIVIRIRDFGKKIDLTKIKEPKLPPTEPNGLGIYFMKTILDDLQYNTEHTAGNEVIMTKFKAKPRSEA